MCSHLMNDFVRRHLTRIAPTAQIIERRLRKALRSFISIHYFFIRSLPRPNRPISVLDRIPLMVGWNRPSPCFGKTETREGLAMGGNGKLSSTPCLDSRLGFYSLRTDTSGDPVNSIECGLISRRKTRDSLIHLNYGIQSLGEERERRKQENKSGRATPHQLLLTIIRSDFDR